MASVPWGINHTCHSPELTIMPALQQILEQLAQQAHDHAMKIVSAGGADGVGVVLRTSPARAEWRNRQFYDLINSR